MAPALLAPTAAPVSNPAPAPIAAPSPAFPAAAPSSAPPAAPAAVPTAALPTAERLAASCVAPGGAVLACAWVRQVRSFAWNWLRDSPERGIATTVGPEGGATAQAANGRTASKTAGRKSAKRRVILAFPGG